ncbi:PLP-dependent aminotransferase family protein [Aeromonas bivalvium]|uniref:aminotransferase-like domain-containing protein n=1 Tax=Aeromonas bivalvium TaxID=440079 RepID=UPI003D1BA7AC
MMIPALAFRPGEPKVVQITDHLGQLIREGVLPMGTRLPSIHALTRQFGVSKFTVVDALDRLKGQQLVHASQGRGYFVSRRGPVPDGDSLGQLLPQDFLSVSRRALIGEQGASRPGCGFLPADWLDGDNLRQALRQVSRQPNLRLAEYGDAAGYRPLRETLRDRLAVLGMALTPGQLVTTANTMQALDLLLRLLLRPGDTVLVDDPCYFNFHGVLSLHGARVLSLPRTPNGPDLTLLERWLREEKPRLYLTSGLLHNPTGQSLSPAQAFSLLALLSRWDCHLVEDDLYGDLLGEVPRLASLGGWDRVTYVSGFSKLLSANLRLGFVAASPALAASLAGLKQVCGGVTMEIGERMLTGLLRDGHYDRQLRRIRQRLCDAGGRVDDWLAGLGCRLEFDGQGGLFRWVRLPDGVNSETLAQSALAEGIALAPGSLFTRSEEGQRHMRLNLAHTDHPELMARLGRLLREGRARGDLAP